MKQPQEDFCTEHIRKDLRGSTVRGGVAILAGQWARRFLQVGFAAVLARLLRPEDFGLVAMVTVVAGLAPVLVDAGLGAAVVQRKGLTQDQVSNLFWLNVGMGLLIAALLAGASPLIALLYGREELVGVTAVLSIQFALSGLTAQHVALMRREMRFTTLEVLSMAAFLVLSVSQILLAWWGWSYWALVWGPVLHAVVFLVLVWYASEWRPGLPNRRGRIGGMLRYGSNLTLANVLNYFTKMGDHFLLGYTMGAQTLGFYQRADSVIRLPFRELNAPFGKLLVGPLARVQDEPDRFRRMFIKGLSAMLFAGVPAVGVIFVMTEELVRVWFGKQWMESVPIIRALSLACVVGLTNCTMSWTSEALGQTHKVLRWALIGPPVTIAAYLVGLYWGPVGVALAFSVSQVLLRGPAFWYFFRGTPIAISDVLGVAWRPFAATGVAVVLAWLVGVWMSRGWPVFGDELADAGLVSIGQVELWYRLLLRLLVGGSVFGVVYLLVWLCLPGGWGFMRSLLHLRSDLGLSKWKRVKRTAEVASA